MTIIFQNRGKQYKANVGDYLKLPRISSLKKNDEFIFDEIVFFKNDKGESFIGSPIVQGVSIKMKVVDQIRDKKIIVFKKKRRHNYRRKIGHRQDLTLFKVLEILTKKTSSANEKKSAEPVSPNLKGESNGS